jgi:bifunctional oligoribonuclease and PAP phosphatase NrnA
MTEASLDLAMDRAAEALRGASSVALACHVNPDADALGSMLGLASYLRSQGKDVVCSWGNQPMVRPRWLAVLDGAGYLVDAKDFPAEPELMVALDTASPDRLGILTATVARAKEVVVIDHHRTNPGFGTIVVLDPSASSTAEMVFRLVERMGGPLPDSAAACLYAGVVTDTGRFQYAATTPETLRVAAELRRHPFDHAAMGQAFYEDGSLGYLRLLSTALDRVAHVREVDLVWTYVTQADLVRAGVELGDLDDLIDVVRTAREADVACIVKQQRDGRFRISLRSRRNTDVGSVAAGFGGGGHRLAAGYTAHGGLEEAADQLIEALRRQRSAPQPHDA